MLPYGYPCSLADRHLCQTAKQHIATSSRLTCKVADRGHPQLLLQPANIETIMLGDDANITVFRDFLTDSEREHLIATARGELERSVASVGSEYAPVEFRVSSVAWLKPNRTTVIEQIHRRIEAATGLDLYSAEELQVCNYGIVGSAVSIFQSIFRPPHRAPVFSFSLSLYIAPSSRDGDDMMCASDVALMLPTGWTLRAPL